MDLINTLKTLDWDDDGITVEITAEVVVGTKASPYTTTAKALVCYRELHADAEVSITFTRDDCALEGVDVEGDRSGTDYVYCTLPAANRMYLHYVAQTEALRVAYKVGEQLLQGTLTEEDMHRTLW